MFTYSNLRTVSEVYKTPFLAGRLRYSCLRQVAEGILFNHSLDLSAGLSVSSFFSKASYKFQMSGLWANGIKTWYGSHSADVSIQAGYNTGENSRVELLCYLPVISNVSRPAYSSSGDYNYEKNDWQIKPFETQCSLPETSGSMPFFPGCTIPAIKWLSQSVMNSIIIIAQSPIGLHYFQIVSGHASCLT